MSIFAALYLISSITALVSSLPQVRQLLITKQSDELSLVTWGMWSTTQVVFLIYASTLDAKELFFMNVLWLIFYITMVALIVYYRRHPGGESTLELESVETEE